MVARRGESGNLLVMFMVKLSAPLVAAMKALRDTSGVKKPSEDDWLLDPLPMALQGSYTSLDGLHLEFIGEWTCIPGTYVYFSLKNLWEVLALFHVHS